MNYLVDLDGTIYRGETAIEAAPDFVSFLQQERQGLLFLTNCPSHTVPGLQAKLARMGIDVDPDCIMTSGQVTARYLKMETAIRRVYLVGGESLAGELAQQGIQLADGQVEAVVVGYDTAFNYEKMTRAVQLIHEGAALIATNGDFTIPAGDRQVPHTGALVAGIAAAAGRQPLIMGKPAWPMLDQALKRLAAKPDQLTIVGDNLETDIKMGLDHQIRTVLVLTGVTKRKQAEDSPIKASLTCSTLTELVAHERRHLA